MYKIEAKPCPFCGAKADVKSDVSQPTLSKCMSAEPIVNCSEVFCIARHVHAKLSEWNQRESTKDATNDGV